MEVWNVDFSREMLEVQLLNVQGVVNREGIPLLSVGINSVLTRIKHTLSLYSRESRTWVRSCTYFLGVSPRHGRGYSPPLFLEKLCVEAKESRAKASAGWMLRKIDPSVLTMKLVPTACMYRPKEERERGRGRERAAK